MGFVSFGEYPDDVEAHGIEVRISLRQVLFGQGAYCGSFTRGHGVEGIAEAPPFTQLDLDEDDGVPVAQDQVQLPVAGAVVALD